jgi:hypothetical protein
MRRTHGWDEKTMVVLVPLDPYHRRMLQSDTSYTRSLTLVLTEPEWRALREAEPDAVGWLQQQVRNRLSAEGPSREPAAPQKSDYPVEDEY